MVFYINLVCTAVVLACFWKELTGFRWRFDVQLWRRMLRYAWPLLVLGIAGILNQTLDKIIFPTSMKERTRRPSSAFMALPQR